MAIVETKLVSRPNTSIPFFSQLDNNNILTGVRTALGPFTVLEDTETYFKRSNASGSHVLEASYSSDLLTQTYKKTYDSLATWSTVDTLTTIALDAEYFAYAEANGLTHPVGQYTLTGIDAPFTCTTTYTYDPAVTAANFDIFTSSLEVGSDKLTSFTNTGTQLIAVHTYTNSTDFTNNHWRDSSFINSLNEIGVTRTISYAMV